MGEQNGLINERQAIGRASSSGHAKGKEARRERSCTAVVKRTRLKRRRLGKGKEGKSVRWAET